MSLRRLAYATACGSEVGALRATDFLSWLKPRPPKAMGAATAHGRGESRDAGFGLAHQKNPEKQTQA